MYVDERIDAGRGKTPGSLEETVEEEAEGG